MRCGFQFIPRVSQFGFSFPSSVHLADVTYPVGAGITPIVIGLKGWTDIELQSRKDRS